MRDGLIHAIYGGVYGKVHDVIDEHKQTGGILPPLAHLGPAAPCGLARFDSDAFGPGYRGNLFACLFNLHKVTRHVLEPDGATYRTRDEDFLAADSPDFHPTDVLEDAGGSLLVIDTGGWYKLCCPTSQLAKPDVLGAIYRVRRTGAAATGDPRGLRVAWSSTSPGGLAALLDDPRPAVRARAVREAAVKGSAAVTVLAAALAGTGSTEGRRNAVWALARIEGEPARAAIRAALGDADPSVRHAAIHAAGVRRDAGALHALLGLLARETPALRRAAAEAIGRIGSMEAVPPLLAAASPADRILEHSIIHALIEIADPAGTAKGLDAESPAVRRAALIALDQMDGGGLDPRSLAPLLASSDPVIRETASWIARRRPEWGSALAGFFRGKLSAGALDGAAAGDLEGQLAGMARDPEVQKLMAEVLEAPASRKEARRLVLRAMGRARLKEAPPAWARDLERVLSTGDADLAREAIFAARALPWGKETAPRLAGPLLAVAGDASVPAEVRLEALAALPPGSPLERGLFEFLRARLDPELPVLVRDAAASALARAKLAPEDLAALAESLRTAGPLEVVRILPAFEGSSDEALGRKLVGALRESPGSSSLHPASLRQVLAKFPDPVRREGEGLVDALGEDVAAQAARLDELLGRLKGGDVRRGQAVFNGPRAACSACHAIGYLGGKAGPDLTKISEVRTERDLLESLIYPSASFVRSYEPMLVVRKDGEIVNGVVLRDSTDEIVLATGPAAEARIPRGEIADVRPGTVSIMPQGLEKLITTEELADLLAFLRATRWHAQ
jgi:putative heme-binding domain-containing protein